MTRAASVLAALIVAGCAAPPVGSGAPPAAADSEWRLVWADEFDSFDESRWDRATHTFDGNDARFVPGNVRVADGLLALTLSADSAGGRPFSGAEVRTDAPFRYGRFETRMRGAPGSGAVSSFFLFRYDPWQEIDVEVLGRRTSGVHFNLFHNPGPEGAPNNRGREVRPMPVTLSLPVPADSAFHVFAVEWGPDRVRWFVDGEFAFEMTEGVPDLPAQLMMNVWASTDEGWAGRVDRGALPARAEYDWVRVYARSL